MPPACFGDDLIIFPALLPAPAAVGLEGYDLAVQTDGATLPVKFKLGTDEKPEYREFDTVDGLADFFKKAMSHIQETLADGWKKKDAFNADDYHTE